MSSPIPIKRGATLLLLGACMNDDGTPIDLTGVTITSQLHDSRGNVAATLLVTVTNAPAGTFTLSAPSSVTAQWSPGQLAGDLCYVQNGSVLYSETFSLAVAPSITAAPAPGP